MIRTSTFDAAAVVAELRRLAERTGGPGGSRRLAWTPEWLEARAFMRESLAGLPVDVEQDAAGNLWVYLRGATDDLVVVGSHLDSVPSGGWLDGALGVIAGVGVLRALCDEVAGTGVPLPCSFAVVDWADEEGARFSRSLFGSAACADTLDIGVLHGLTDRWGHTLPEVLAEHGVDITKLDSCRSLLAKVKAYLELHIEQGPVLEAHGLGIATVTGTVGIERERFIFSGQAAHAGTMPMAMRRDSFRAAGRFALAMAEIGERHNGVTTVGSAQLWPGVVTAVAGETRVTMDMRHISAESLAAMFAEAQQAAADAAALEGCTVMMEHIFRIPPMPFHQALLDVVRDEVEREEGHRFELPSGALHDASEIARTIPTAMIFTSSIAGLSHTKEEDTPDEHLAMGANAFMRAVRRTIDMVAAGGLS